jgi:hypothetical protein
MAVFWFSGFFRLGRVNAQTTFWEVARRFVRYFAMTCLGICVFVHEWHNKHELLEFQTTRGSEGVYIHVSVTQMFYTLKGEGPIVANLHNVQHVVSSGNQ